MMSTMVHASDIPLDFVALIPSLTMKKTNNRKAVYMKETNLRNCLRTKARR